jgi:PAS domain S-box-containing protein
MPEKATDTEHSARLRRRAEDLSRSKGEQPIEKLEGLSLTEIRQMIHELRVHQIELNLQNEELRRAQEELEATRARYFDFYELAPVGYCIISLEGLILEANLTAVTLLGAARATLVKQPITRFILKEDQDIYYLHRKHLFATGEPHACELRMVKTDGEPFWVRLTATSAQQAGTHSGPSSQTSPASRMVIIDITERKQAEAEYAKVALELKAARNRRRGRPKAVSA